MMSPIKIFCCYARKDQALLNRLKTHLISLQRQGLITTWADTDISPGKDWESEINKHINSAQIILLLISPDFMASNYCYSKEMTQALDRHKQGNTCVIPIILRPTYFQGAPFEKLQVLPKDAKPLKKWSNIDEGFLSVIEGIQLAIKNLPQTPQLNTFSHPTSNQPVVHLTFPGTQIPLSPPNPIPQPTTNQPSNPSTSRAYRLPLLNTPILSTTNRAATPPTPVSSPTPPLKSSSYPTTNQPPTQQLPIPQTGTIKSPPKFPLLLMALKIITYFVGAFIAGFGFLGGAVTFAGPNKDLNTTLGGFAFFIGTIAFLTSTIIFFRKQYYRYHLRYIQYMWIIIIETSLTLAILFLVLSINISPIAKSDFLCGIITVYGISLIIATYLKPSP